MQLTEHFSLAEMTRSQTAIRKGMANVPGVTEMAALILVCKHVLEPVRAKFGPVAITSGYRSPAVNKACGGAKGSQHIRGEAADFTVPGRRNIDLAQWIMHNLTYDQLIYEFGEAGWLHVSWVAGARRNQELSAKRTAAGTKYLPGLIP